MAPTGDELVAAARAYLGVPYTWGGKSAAEGLDCSGLITLAMADVGLEFPHGSTAQIAACSPVSPEEAWATPGAILWRPGHDALSTGDGHTLEATRNPRDGVHSYPRSARFVAGGLIPGIDYTGGAQMKWVNPARGNIEPLVDNRTGKAVKGYGPRAPFKLPSGKFTATFHAGVDITGPRGTPVCAAGDGYVVHAGPAGTGLTVGRTGTAVVLAHSDGSGTYYGHLDTLAVRTGQKVTSGQVIGAMGDTGEVTGVHLHFEKRPNARYTATQDPVAWASHLGITLGTDPDDQEDDMALTPAEHDALVRTEALVAFVADQLGHGKPAGPLWHANRKLDLVLAELAKTPAAGGDVDEAAIARAVVEAMDESLARAVLVELRKALPA